jgi:hypothetical protein
MGKKLRFENGDVVDDRVTVRNGRVYADGVPVAELRELLEALDA